MTSYALHKDNSWLHVHVSVSEDFLNLSIISDRKQYRTQGDFSDTEGVLAKVLATMS